MSGLSINDLATAVRALLDTHPALSAEPPNSSASRQIHLKPYSTLRGAPIGFRNGLKTECQLWVRRDDVRLHRLSDIAHQIKTLRDFKLAAKEGRKGANSNLFAVEAFRDADLVCFKFDTLAAACRVVSEVAG